MALVVLAAAGTALAAGDTVSTTVPFAGSRFSDCTGELIAFDGTMHVTTRLNTNGDRTHEGLHSHISAMSVTTLNGARYVLSETQNGTSTTTSDGSPSNFTVIHRVVLTRLGEDKTFVDGDDMHQQVTAHGTINANGTVTVDKLEIRDECR